MNEQECAEQQVYRWIQGARGHFAAQGVAPEEVTSEAAYEYIQQREGREHVLETLRVAEGNPTDAEILTEYQRMVVTAMKIESGNEVKARDAEERKAIEWATEKLRHDPNFAQRVRAAATAVRPQDR